MSTFSILPPFNVVQAQVVQRTGTGTPRVLGPDQVTLSYEAVADASGSINTTSLGGKTDFWSYVTGLFGISLPFGQGILGFWMPADAPVPGPQPIPYHATLGHFRAPGIPITAIDDDYEHNFYPLLRLVARDEVTGDELAHLDIVTPVSDETDCQSCHRTGELAADDPTIAWSNDPDPEIQAKTNVLILHDHDEGTDLVGSQPVLCAGCHYSAALDLSGSGPPNSLPTESAVMHEFHGLQLNDDGSPVFPPNGSAGGAGPGSTCRAARPATPATRWRG